VQTGCEERRCVERGGGFRWIIEILGIKKAEKTLAVFRPTSTYENNPFGKGCWY